jgi:2,5-furandicarboxylate decarboxylase 1
VTDSVKWPAAAHDLRAELRLLEDAGLLTRVRRRADPRFQIAALARACETGPALLFEAVTDSRHPVVINTQASRAMIAASFGVQVDQVARRYAHALRNPVAPVLVADGPVQEEVLAGESLDLAAELPVLTHHEGDAGPYLTTGVVIAEDRELGVRNLSYHRMQLRGGNETGMVVVQRHLHRLLDRAESAGRALPVAVVLGLSAAVRLAAATSGSATPFGFDELGIAGALQNRSLPLVQCRTIPVCVPADAEIVLEGEIVPGRWEDEGPFAEFDGEYESEPARVFRVTALTRRRDAMYQGLTSGAREQLNIMGLPNEGVLFGAIRAVLPGLRDVRVTLGGLRKFHAIVSVDKQHDGDGMDAIVAAFAGHRDLKHVIVVDGDVSPHDSAAVERAIATHVQASRDMVVIPGGRGNPVDRSLRAGGVTDRVGVDATRPLGSSGDTPRAVIPGAEHMVLSDWL